LTAEEIQLTRALVGLRHNIMML